MKTLMYMAVAVAASTVAFTGSLSAADLPAATQKALAELKIDASELDGLDAELAVPQAWLDGAAKEERVTILSTWRPDQFRTMTAPFVERYPQVKLDYQRSGTDERGMKVIIALREGRVLGDVITSIADAMFQFNELKALADLRDLPGFKNQPADLVAADGTWASFKTSFRCMAYNTTLLKPDQLPATWDDLLTNEHFRNGNLAVSNVPSSWLLALWADKGEAWGRDFTKRLFTEVKPQQRKEGMSAATSLTVAGEFHANQPSPEWLAQQLVDKGAPLNYHCPSPVPVNVSQIVMLEKSPHKNSARLFINWLISKEGQILQYSVTNEVPVHPALQSKRFLPFGETLAGKPRLVRDNSMLGGPLHAKMNEAWVAHWTAGGGE